MRKQTKPLPASAIPLKRESCIFKALSFIALPAGDYAAPGDIIDMSDCADESIRWHLENGAIETADGKPVNKLSGKRDADRPCPCNK